MCLKLKELTAQQGALSISEKQYLDAQVMIKMASSTKA